MSDKSRNIKNVVKFHLCCSCGLCSNYCRHHAITYRINALGFYEPIIDDKKCINCGICLKSCPGINDLKDYTNKESRYFYGYSTDDEMHLNASSGGIVTELLCYLISNKIVDYVTCVTTRTGEQLPMQIVTNDIEIIKECRTSKYCPVQWKGIIEKIEQVEGSIAIVALPCQINSLKNYFKKRKVSKKIKFFFSLMCNHMPSLKAAEYIVKGYNKKAVLKKVINRGGGFPGYMTYEIQDSGGSVCFRTPFRKIWAAGYGRYFKNRRCILCNDPFAKSADATFGDSYFLQNTDKKGTTFCIVRNLKVTDILMAMQKGRCIELQEGPDEKAIRKTYEVLFDREMTFLQKNKCLQILHQKTIVPINSFVKLDFRYACHFYKDMFIAQLGKYQWLWPYLSEKNKLMNLIIINKNERSQNHSRNRL